MTTAKQKFDAILDMMDVLAAQHNERNKALAEFNEGKHRKPFDTVKVDDIKAYCYDLLLEIAKDI